MSRAWIVACLLFTGCAASAGPTRGAFESDLAVDTLSTAGMLAVGILVDREKYGWHEVSPCHGDKRAATRADQAQFAGLSPQEGTCEVSRVPALDRPVTTLKWDAARPMSDVGLLSMLAMPFAVSAIHTGVQGVPSENFGIDGLVITQTLSATLMATALMKVMVARARPLTYNPDFDKAVRYSGDARLSFPSGHSALAFSAASATAVMLLRRYPGGRGAYLGTLGAYLGATSVATLRVLAGKHFITDVLAGAALGTVIGLAIPLAHVNEGETEPTGLGQNRSTVPVLGFGGAF